MAPHQWESAEELALFDISERLLNDNDKEYRSKTELNREIANELNKKFPVLDFPFNERIIRSKLSIFKARWKCQGHLPPKRRKLITCDKVSISGHETTFETLFSGESTNSGALSLTRRTRQRSSEVGTPESSHTKAHVSAMKYLRENNVRGDSDEYTMANEVLKDEANLGAFNTLPDFKEKMGFVVRTWNVKVHGRLNAGDMNS